MALPILDGNQTAATLSTVLTGGEHIPAHTVVSLGSQAITDVRSAVSGSVVSISNFPTTQTIAGTVTVGASSVTFNSNVAKRTDGSWQPLSVEIGSGYVSARVYSSDIAPFLATVTVGNSVTIGSVPAISGTVTANLKSDLYDGANDWNLNRVAVHATVDGTEWKTVGTDVNSIPLPISGTVTANLDQLSLTNALDFFAVNYTEAFPVSLQSEISGTVTAAAPNGLLTTRFGTPTTANVSFATSAVTNANRKYLLIQNVTTGSNVITVGIGFTPTTTQGIQLTAGAGITFESSYIPTGAVQILSSVTASNFTILEA